MAPTLRPQHGPAPTSAYAGAVVTAVCPSPRALGQPGRGPASIEAEAGVVLKSLSTRESPHPRAEVHFPLSGTIVMAVCLLSVVGCSRDARIGTDARGGAVYAAGYVECVVYLHEHGFWERRLHLDVLLAALAPALVPQQAPGVASLVCWCFGVGIGVYFHIVQNILAARLTGILGVPVGLCFVGFELADRLEPTRRILRHNSSPGTTWSMREDVLSCDLTKVGVIHDVHVCLPCAPLSHTGGGGDANAREFLHEEFTAACTNRSTPLLSTPWADALVHSVLLVGAARLVNPACSFTYETSAHARKAALDTVFAMFVCVLAGAEPHARVVHCEQTSAMRGKRFIITSSASEHNLASAPPPLTIESLMAGYLATLASVEDGVGFAVSAEQRSHFLRLTSGYYASSTMCDGQGRFAGYTLKVDMWRHGVLTETLSVPLGFELLCRLYGLRSWHLDQLVHSSWHVVCSMVSGAIPARTLAPVITHNFDTRAFVLPPGEVVALRMGLPICKVHIDRIVDGTKRIEYRLCTLQRFGQLQHVAGTGKAIYVSFTCMPHVRCLRYRATVGAPIPMHDITDPVSRLALIELADSQWLQAQAHGGAQAAAAGVGPVTHVFPIILLAKFELTDSLQTDDE